MSENPSALSAPEGLGYISAISWEEVKASWKRDEDSDSFRREYPEHGYQTWEEWREAIIAPLHLHRLDWHKYTLDEPAKSVPMFKGGPFKSWAEQYYGGKEFATFADIAKSDASDVKTRDKFAKIISADEPIRLIGLLLGGEVYIIEGMHRATSIALAAARGIELHSPVTLVLAQSDLSEFKTIE